MIDYILVWVDLKSSKEHNAYQREYACEEKKHSYIMTLNSDEVINVDIKGNFGQYINSSHNPNYQMDKLIVNG